MYLAIKKGLIIKLDVVKLMLDCGACDAGVSAFAPLLDFMDAQQRQRAFSLCSNAKTVFVGAFPYYVNPSQGSLSLYARGEDYHKVLTRRLEPVCRALRTAYPKNVFISLVDSSPLPEKAAAVRAGLGCIGQNCLFISNSGGSFVFLGCILSDLQMDAIAHDFKSCINCGCCVSACPTGAIGPGRTIDAALCLSAITQKKGVLEPWEAEAIKKAPSAWGCDICQLVCPANAGLSETYIEEFSGGTAPYLRSLQPEDLEQLSNSQFEKRYGNRAFSYRGRATILRDMKLFSEK